MPDLTKDQLHDLAHLGAQAHLALLDVEISAIRRAYPDLVSARRPGRPRKAQPESAPAAKTRKPYRMSPAARKAAGERMRAYWAAKRQAKEAQQPGETMQEKPARKPRGARRKAGKKR